MKELSCPPTFLIVINFSLKHIHWLIDKTGSMLIDILQTACTIKLLITCTTNQFAIFIHSCICTMSISIIAIQVFFSLTCDYIFSYFNLAFGQIPTKHVQNKYISLFELKTSFQSMRNKKDKCAYIHNTSCFEVQFYF